MKIQVGEAGIFGATDPREVTGMLEILGYGDIAYLKNGIYRVERIGTKLPGVQPAQSLWGRLKQARGKGMLSMA